MCLRRHLSSRDTDKRRRSGMVHRGKPWLKYSTLSDRTKRGSVMGYEDGMRTKSIDSIVLVSGSGGTGIPRRSASMGLREPPPLQQEIMEPDAKQKSVQSAGWWSSGCRSSGVSAAEVGVGRCPMVTGAGIVRRWV
jgi:hypothetical protein